MEHILIIEDDRAIARIEKDYLEAGGFRVTLAEDGETGCRIALQQPFDLILLDVMLPGMDGFLVLQQLRRQLDVPILLVTARTEDLDKIRGLGLGADDYIEKPFSPGVLVARIRANLAQYTRLKQGGQAGELRAGDLRLDVRARRVWRADVPVELKNREYELLYFFMRNPGQVFDREVLYDRVWGLDAMGDSATVAVHINRLREKLGEGHIQTIRGAGYRFE